MSRPAAKTLVFYDFETTGLFEKPTNVNMEPPRVIPGDKRRNNGELFRIYAEQVDSHAEKPNPRITELSFVAVPRKLFEEGVIEMQKKCSTSGRSEKLKLEREIPTSVMTRQTNPELDEKEWYAYEKNRRSCSAIHLKRSDLEHQPTFQKVWPVVHAFLSSLEGPVVMIAHNGLRYDCRVLLAELRRTNLLDTYPIPSNFSFVDSYIMFMDIEKRYQNEAKVSLETINWKLIADNFLTKRPAEFKEDVTPTKRMKTNNTEDSVNESGECSEQQNQINCADNDQANATDTDDCIIDCVLVRPDIKLKRPPGEPYASPPRNNQVLPIDGSRTAPAKLIDNSPTAEELSKTNPFNFLRTSSWSPAKKRRLRPDFFERKDDHDWVFSTALTNDYFNKRNNFRLFNLHKEIIGDIYAEHHAFDDCIALLRLCMAYGFDFLKYMDDFATPLPILSGT